MRLSTNRLECASTGCIDRLRLERETTHAFGFDDIYAALVQAGTVLGWRRNVDTQTVHCPKHAADLQLVCTRCATWPCFCMGGERFEARPGEWKDPE